METTDDSVYIRLIPNENGRRMSDSDKDRPLLESLLVDDRAEYPRRRHACTGRFLTMHKRRRKKLTTRGLLQDPAMLDDVLHGQVQCILNQVDNWRFNAFTLETVTGGRSLPVLCVHLFHVYGLLDQFHLDVVRLWKLFSLIEEGYHSTNPYHNSIHATDVTQAMHCFLQESAILEHMQPIEIMASLLGAVTHDLDHPGVNQPFLIATSNHLAALYENTSVLENHHWRSAVGCLLESGVAEQIHSIRPQLEEQISSLILATDITRQQEFLAQFRRYLDTDTLDMRLAEHRHFILQIALKSADISNPCRPWDVSKKWSQKVCEEFFRQGDYERQLNLPVTSLCDRFSTSVPKIQVGFFKFVVTPLFDEWHRFLSSPLSRRMMRYLKYNQVQWESKVAAELAEETRTEISDTEVLEVADVDDVDDAIGERKTSSVGDGGAGDMSDHDKCEHEEDDDEDEDMDGGRHPLSDSSEVLLPTADVKKQQQPRRSSLQIPAIVMSRFDRRHSVPVNPLPKIILPNRENRSRDAIREERTESVDLAELQMQLQQKQQLQQQQQHQRRQQQRFDNDTFSLLSSDDSDSYRRGGGGGLGAGCCRSSADNSGGGGGGSERHTSHHHHHHHERPLSAETLVPDLSIATMSDCADRLNIVMHGSMMSNAAVAGLLSATASSASNKLIRQQTFPPIQPYVRARYLSAAADMGACNEMSSSSSASPSEMDLGSAAAAARTLMATIPFAPMSTSVSSSASCGVVSGSGGSGSGKREPKAKREPSDAGDKTASKMAKLCVDLGSHPVGQKENVDPSMLYRRGSSYRRRGSAPVVIALTTSGGADIEEPSIFKTCDRFGRRGSMPAEVIRNFFTDPPAVQEHHQHHQQHRTTTTISDQAAPIASNLTAPPVPRRGSMPCDSLSAVFGQRSLHHHNNNNNNGNNKQPQRSGSRKKLLRRRSAGGNADILAPIFGGDPLDDDDDAAPVDGGNTNTTTTTIITPGESATSDNNAADDALMQAAAAAGTSSSSSTIAASVASSARYRLKRASEATLTRGAQQQQQQQQRSEMEAMLSRRRGSLPVEMLSISCSGNIRH